MDEEGHKDNPFERLGPKNRQASASNCQKEIKTREIEENCSEEVCEEEDEPLRSKAHEVKCHWTSPSAGIVISCDSAGHPPVRVRA